MPTPSMLDFKRLFESVPDLYMVLAPTPGFEIVAVSDAYLNATLTRRSEVVDRSLFDVFPDNPDDTGADGVHNLRLSLEQVLRDRAPNTMAVQKYDIRAADGTFEVRYWSPVNYPVFDTEGNISCIIHRAEDVTDFVKLKRSQEFLATQAENMESEIYLRAQEVQKANQQLAETLATLRARNEEMVRKNVELELASKAKSEFLANMSHELRTPLNSIIGFSDVLKAGLGGTLSQKQSDYLGHISNSGQHLLALINDILDLSKVEAGKMELSLSESDLGALLGSSLAILKERAMLRGVKLALDVAGDINKIHLDERKFKQIVYNLLSNAIKFSEPETQVGISARRVPRSEVGRIDTRHAHRTLPIAAGDFAEFIEIRITDQGMGISQEGLDRLFQPFTQIDTGLARQFEGTGLGLVMVMRLVELHGGGVGVSSEEGAGSCFTVWLPLRAAHLPVPEAAAPAPAVAASPGASVALIIEDDDKAAEIVALQLAEVGLQTERVSNAEEGLALARQKQYALVALDILLPGMDGWEFLARLKDYPETATLPVIIISIVADHNRGVSLGASAILQKPVSAQALHAALSNLGVGKNRAANVLVVDDDPQSVEIIAGHLKVAGCSTLRAYGGKEGVAAAMAQQPELIILDLTMPGMSGFEVVEALKSDERTARIPILIVTGKQVSRAERETLNGRVMEIVEKSDFNHGRFISEVRRVLGTP
ncbi:MAG: response regulator [Rhodocyclaceae bacterium]|nr:response regulator [Rhodocyclaceae bacterium]